MKGKAHTYKHNAFPKAFSFLSFSSFYHQEKSTIFSQGHGGLGQYPTPPTQTSKTERKRESIEELVKRNVDPRYGIAAKGAEPWKLGMCQRRRLCEYKEISRDQG